MRGIFQDLTGKRFNRLVVLNRLPHNDKNHSALWVCRCDCGQERVIASKSLNYGNSGSCGCASADHLTRHGHTRNGNFSKTFNSWRGMMDRCYSASHVHYRYYGERGIIVCGRWHTFSLFLQDMGERPEGMSLDRIDGGAEYSPDNCRWSTSVTQARNRSNARLLPFDGEFVPLAEIAEKLKLPYWKLAKMLGPERIAI